MNKIVKIILKSIGSLVFVMSMFLLGENCVYAALPEQLSVGNAKDGYITLIQDGIVYDTDIAGIEIDTIRQSMIFNSFAWEEESGFHIVFSGDLVLELYGDSYIKNGSIQGTFGDLTICGSGSLQIEGTGSGQALDDIAPFTIQADSVYLKSATLSVTVQEEDIVYGAAIYAKEEIKISGADLKITQMKNRAGEDSLYYLLLCDKSIHMIDANVNIRGEGKSSCIRIGNATQEGSQDIQLSIRSSTCILYSPNGYGINNVYHNAIEIGEEEYCYRGENTMEYQVPGSLMYGTEQDCIEPEEANYFVFTRVKCNFPTLESLLATPLETPQMKIKQNAYHRLRLEWNGVKDADEYRIYRSTKKNGTYKLIRTVYTQFGKTAYAMVDKTTTGVVYFYKVYAVQKISGKMRSSNHPDIIAGRSKVATCAITNLASKKTGLVQLTWKRIYGANGYEIYKSSSKNGRFIKAATVNLGQTLTRNLKATSKRTLYYKIRAFRKVNGKKVYGSFSSVKSVRVR